MAAMCRFRIAGMLLFRKDPGRDAREDHGHPGRGAAGRRCAGQSSGGRRKSFGKDSDRIRHPAGAGKTSLTLTLADGSTRTCGSLLPSAFCSLTADIDTPGSGHYYHRRWLRPRRGHEPERGQPDGPGGKELPGDPGIFLYGYYSYLPELTKYGMISRIYNGTGEEDEGCENNLSDCLEFYQADGNGTT